MLLFGEWNKIKQSNTCHSLLIQVWPFAVTHCKLESKIELERSHGYSSTQTVEEEELTGAYAFFASRNLLKIPLKRLGTNGLDRVQQALVERKRYPDYEMVYHKNCYVTFTSSLPLGRPKKHFDAKKSPCADEEASASSKNQTLRSNMETLDSDLYIFCQSVSSETNQSCSN